MIIHVIRVIQVWLCRGGEADHSLRKVCHSTCEQFYVKNEVLLFLNKLACSMCKKVTKYCMDLGERPTEVLHFDINTNPYKSGVPKISRFKQAKNGDLIFSGMVS